MPSCGILRRVALVRTDVSEERSASIIRITSQKTPFFIITAVKPANLTFTFWVCAIYVTTCGPGHQEANTACRTNKMNRALQMQDAEKKG
jgi:hypothetical protein